MKKTIIDAGAKQAKFIIVEEKTEIQALSRFQEEPEIGKNRRIEFEYKRNGTIGLIAGINVGTGKLCHHQLHPTRTEKDFVNFIEKAIEKIPDNEEIIFLSDQLNTHYSETLVQLIAKKIDFEGDLGEKGKTGILHSKLTRKTFLSDSNHRIRFVYTPKHCSWLNPIENWFGRLEKNVIKYGNFPSVENLIGKIEDYIKYYNESLFKPFQWKFKGFKKDSPFEKFK